jgi:hypothetical protein
MKFSLTVIIHRPPPHQLAKSYYYFIMVMIIYYNYLFVLLVWVPSVILLNGQYVAISPSRPGRFTPREGTTDSHWIGGWVSPRAVLDAEVKRKIPSHRWDQNLEPRSSSP